VDQAEHHDHHQTAASAENLISIPEAQQNSTGGINILTRYQCAGRKFFLVFSFRD